MNKDILVRLMLNSKGFTSEMGNANRSVSVFVDSQKALSAAGKGVVSYLGKMAAGAGAAMTVMDSFEKVISSTQTATDAMGRAMEIAKSSVDSFFYALSQGDFSSFLSGLQDVAKYAKEAYDALDDLGTFNIFKDANVAEMNEKMDRLKTEIKSGKTYTENEDRTVTIRELTKKEIEVKVKELEQAGKDYVNLISTTKEKEQAAYEAVAKQILSGKSFKGTEEEMMAAANYYLANYKNYSEVEARLKVLNKQIASKQKTENTFSGAGAGAIRKKTGTITYDTPESLAIKQSAEYRNLTALKEIGDDPLKQLLSHRINAASAGSELNRLLLGNEKAISKGTGGTKVGKTTEVEAAVGSVKELQNQLMEATKQLDALAYGTEAWDEQKAKVEELTDKVSTLKDEISAAMSAKNADIVAKEADNFDFFAAANEGVDSRYKIEIPIEFVPLDEQAIMQEELEEMQDAFNQYAENLTEKMAKIGETVGGVSGLFAQLGDVIGGTTGDNIKAMGQMLSAVQQMIPVIQSLMMVEEASALTSKEEATGAMMAAAAKAGKSVAGVPLAGPALAIAAITSILGMVGAIKSMSFAEGGVVGGNSYNDGINARISTGEVVFNQHDAKQLYEAVHSGNIGGGGGSVVLRGEDLWISFGNFLSRTGRGKIQLG